MQDSVRVRRGQTFSLAWLRTVGHSGIVVSYSRMLVQLDSADEFKSLWFNGVARTALEQTGAAAANDAA